MKKVLVLSGIYLLMIICSVSCFKPDHLMITDIRFWGAAHNSKGALDSTSVFQDDVIFIISPHYEVVAGLNLIQSCYAFKKALIHDNELLRDTYSIKFDRGFVYDNDSVTAEQDIFQIDKIKREINIFANVDGSAGPERCEVLDFSDNFKNKVKFETGPYQVKFSCKTSDGLEFKKKINVEFKL